MKTIVFAALATILSISAADFALGQVDRSRPAPVGPGLHARLFDAHLQPLLADCDGQERTVACINGLWDVADVSGDGELSIAEITRLFRIVSGKVAHQAYLDEYEEFRSLSPNQGAAVPPEANEAVVVAGAATVGPIVSRALIANFDYDNNGLISRVEALNDVAADIVLSSVEDLPPEIRSHASKAVGFLMQFLMKK